MRDVNAVIFPDWSQPEGNLHEELRAVIQTLQKHPDSRHISLLIDSNDQADETVYLMISGIMMDLLMENALEAEEPAVSVIEKFNQAYWAPWLCRLHVRIALPHDNHQTIAKRAPNLPVYSLVEFENKRVTQLESGLWQLSWNK